MFSSDSEAEEVTGRDMRQRCYNSHGILKQRKITHFMETKPRNPQQTFRKNSAPAGSHRYRKSRWYT